MSGKVPLSRNTQLRRAAALYEDFSGHDADEIERVKKPDIPDVLTVIGSLEGVIYTTTRDGKPEKYIHRFKRGSQGLLCVGPDGDQLFIIGGKYLFTDRGIVDK